MIWTPFTNVQTAGHTSLQTSAEAFRKVRALSVAALDLSEINLLQYDQTGLFATWWIPIVRQTRAVIR